MRDPNRIEPMLAKLREAWYANPQWRLCQLISNAHGTGPQDIFYTEDTTLAGLLEALVEPATCPKCLGEPDGWWCEACKNTGRVEDG